MVAVWEIETASTLRPTVSKPVSINYKVNKRPVFTGSNIIYMKISSDFEIRVGAILEYCLEQSNELRH